MKKTSYKRGPRFGPDMIKHVQSTPTTIETTIPAIPTTTTVPVVENPIQTVVVEETSSKTVEVVEVVEVVETIEVIAPVVVESKENTSETIADKQQETAKINNERRRR